MRQYLKYFIPPILTKERFREVYNRKFFKDKVKRHYEYENDFFTRHAFINKAVSQYENCKYLEIGVANNSVFNSIPLKAQNKFGVDPVRGGNFRMTSDDFFQKNNHLKFDVIFIDGLHTYEQCQKDCLNSMKSLNPGGIIFFHDLLPRSYFEENVPRRQSAWSGDVWKVGVELNNSENIEFRIVNIDHGVGILKLKTNFHYQKMDNLKKESFAEFLKYKKDLPIISSEDALEFISKDAGQQF